MEVGQPVQVNNNERGEEPASKPELRGLEVGRGPSKEITGIYAPNGWERFLEGDRCCCPCCACWLFFGLGWLFTFILIFKIALAEDPLDVFSFEDMPVRSDPIVQAFYAFTTARGERSSCDDEQHEDEAYCRADNVSCAWDAERGICKGIEVCPEPPAKPRSTPLREPESSGVAWVAIIYEAQDGGNILDDSIMHYMKKFEDTLLTTANGAETVSGPSRWDEDWCYKVYPDGNPTSTGKCGPITSLVGVFTMTPEGMDATRTQAQAGYHELSGALADCICSTSDNLCGICNPDGSVRSMAQMPTCLMNLRRRLSEANVSRDPVLEGRRLTSGANSSVNPMCMAADLSNPEVITSFLTMVCRGSPSCQWAPPGTSWTCGSNAFFHPTDAPGLLTGTEKNAVIEKMCDDDNTGWANQRKTVLPRSFSCANKHARYARTFFFTGKPDPNRRDEDSYKEFKEDYVMLPQKGWYHSAKRLEADIEAESDHKLRIILYSQVTLRQQFLDILAIDGALSTASLVMVWLYMWWTLESFFLASCAMFEIVFSLPVAMFVWHVIGQQKVTFYQMLVIYMILGIGADDAFILYDAWMYARFAGDEVMQHWTTRFAYAYRRSFKAMLITTLTTCGSFVIGAFSPLPTVSGFCIFAAIVVGVDYLFCVSFFASSVVVFERFFKNNKKSKGQCCGPGCCWGCCRRMSLMLCGNRCVEEEPGPGELPKKQALRRFSEGPLFRFLAKFKILLVVFWLIIMIAMLISAGVQLRTARKRNPVGRENIDVIRGFDILLEEFTIGEQRTISFVYGLDRKEPITEWHSNLDGNHELQWSSTDSVTSPEGQLQLLRLCNGSDLGSAGGHPWGSTRCEDTGCIVLGQSAAGRCAAHEQTWKRYGFYMPSDVFCLNGRYCFMEEFAEFWASKQGNCRTRGQTDCINSASCAWQATSAGGYCYPTTSWLDYPGLPRDDFIAQLNGAEFLTYRSARRDAMMSMGRRFETELEPFNTGWQMEGNRMKLAWVSFNATIPFENTVEEANDWYSRWEDYRSRYGAGLGGFQTTEVYVFMVTQNEMVKAAVLGIFLSLFVAFLVMMFTTQNWRVALLGLFNITGITCVFLGIMPLLDWSLGESECIFLIAVVGLSVDYTVHLLHSYHHGVAEGDARDVRAKYALSDMGISVTNSAVTTLLASAMLFGCGFYFFFQFGAFIFFVIGFSIVMSITFLIPLLLLMGPEGTAGDFDVMKCLRSMRRGENAKVVAVEQSVADSS